MALPGGMQLVSGAVRALVGVGLLAGGVAIFGFLSSTREAPSRRDEPVELPLVRVMTVTTVSVPVEWEGYGTARAMDVADVAAEVGARVVTRPEGVEAGAAVAKGQVLLQLDPTDFEQRVVVAEQALTQSRTLLSEWEVEEDALEERAALARTEAEIQEREYKRLADALEKDAARPSEVELRLVAYNRALREASSLAEQHALMLPRRDRLLAQIRAQEADLRVAQEDLRRTTIISPIDGTLQEMRGEAGELMARGAQVARVVSLATMEVPIRVPMSAEGTTGVGDAVELRPDTPGPGDLWRGVIARVAPEADAATRTMTLFVEVRQDPAAARVLRPGQFVVARIRSAARADRIVAPRGAVDAERVMVAEATDQAGAHVVRSVQVKVERFIDGQWPELDPRETQWAVVSEGLTPGQRVIVSNLSSLEPGGRVRVGEGAPGGAP